MGSSHLLLCVLFWNFCLISLGSTEHNFAVVPTSSFASEPACSSGSQVISDPNSATMPLVHRHGSYTPLGSNTIITNKPSMTERLRRDRARRNLIISKAAGLSTMPSNASVNIPTALGDPVDSPAEYVVTLGIGTPAVQQTVLIDTGSDLSWVQCKPCNSSQCYPRKDPLFDPSRSSTYKTIPCQSDECKNLNKTGYHGDCTNGNVCSFSIGPYGDGSNTNGVYSTEALTLAPGVTIRDFQFGCSHDHEGLHGDYDGLLGLGGAPESFVSQTAEQYGRAFSYCLPRGNGTAGFLALGTPSNKTDGFVLAPMHQFAPAVSTFYMVTLAGISVAGKQLDIPPAVFSKGMIVDSGSVITQLPKTAYSALQSAFRSAMSAYPLLPPNENDLDTCYNFTGYSNVTVPTVSLTFSGGATIDLDVPSGVMVEDCLAFDGDSSDNVLFGVLGNVNQRTFEVLYDSGRGNIGFRPGAC